MAFTLDTPSGKGSKTVKISADKNNEDSPKTAQLLVQVNGVTKQVVQLVQKASGTDPGPDPGPDPVYRVYIQTDVSSVPAAGGDVKITYWVTKDGEITEDVPELFGTYYSVSSGIDSTGRHWMVDRIPSLAGGASYMARFNGLSAEVDVLQKYVEVKLEVDQTVIADEGGSAIFTYWSLDDGEINGDNLELLLESGSATEIQYTLGSPRKDDLGRISRSINIQENPTMDTKTLKFKVKHSVEGIFSNVVSINIEGLRSIQLPNFDFFVFNLEWDNQGGEDLYSATFVEGSGINMVSGGILDTYFVGAIGNGNEVEEVTEFLEYGGDNTNISGREGALISFKNICSRLKPRQGITKLYAYIYCNWYQKKGSNGGSFIKIKTYKGTGMNKSGYTFYPDNNTHLITQVSDYFSCDAYSAANNPGDNIINVKDWYSKVAIIEYDVTTNSAVVKFKSNRVPNGRSVEESIDVSEVHVSFNTYGKGNLYLPVHRGVAQSIGLSFENGIEKITTGSYVSENPLKVSGNPTVENPVGNVPDWLSAYVVNDSENNVTGIRYTLQENNSSIVRTAYINVYFTSSVRSSPVHLRIEVKQDNRV